MTTRKYQIPVVPPTPENAGLHDFLESTKRVAEDGIDRIETLEAASLPAYKNHQVIDSGQFRPDPTDSKLHYLVNDGAFILLPPTTSCSIVLATLNGSSAGTITTSSFDTVTGTPNTTAGNVWFAKITVILGYSLLEWVQVV